MEFNEVMKALEGYGNPQTKKVLINHGAREPFFGVKIGDMKKILKKTKKDHELALKLYSTGNSDAMYLAGLMADETKMSKRDLQNWIKEAYWYLLSEYAVASLAAETPYGLELGLEWIDSDQEHVAAAGWSALGNIAGTWPEDQVDPKLFSGLLDRVEKELDTAPNRVRYTMNGFVIATGTYLPSLTDKCIALGNRIGKVKVDMGGTACKVPYSPQYIEKVKSMGKLGKKRKAARC